MKKLFLVTLLMGCMPASESELSDRVSAMEKCKAYKIKVDSAKMVNAPESVQKRIEYCRQIGAWE